MNPLVLRRIELLHQAAAKLDKGVVGLRETLVAKSKEGEELLREQWRLRRDAVALQRAQDDFEAIKSERDTLENACRDLRAGLQAVLKKTSQLRSEAQK